MPTQYIRRGADLGPSQNSKVGASAIFVDSADDQLKFTTGASGTTVVDVVTESQTQTLTNKTLTAPVMAGERSVDVTDDKTLAAADAGIIQNVTVDAKTITLPATVVGLAFRVRNGGADGAVAVTVSPDAADLIQGNGFTAADNKDAINTKSTAKNGDEITLIANGTTGWTLSRVVGTWAREA